MILTVLKFRPGAEKMRSLRKTTAGWTHSKACGPKSCRLDRSIHCSLDGSVMVLGPIPTSLHISILVHGIGWKNGTDNAVRGPFGPSAVAGFEGPC